MKKRIWILLFILMLAGCGNTYETAAVQQDALNSGKEKESNTDISEPKGYVFEYSGVKIGMDMHAAPILSELGEPASYFEAPSCAFDGLSKTYSYGSFEIDTYELDNEDFIAGIFFCDDMIETSEGVCLFDTKDTMVAAYGENYTEEHGMLVYQKDGMKIGFLLDGNEITSIEYMSTFLDDK